MDTLKDMTSRWSLYQRVDSSEELLHKEQDDYSETAEIVKYYRKLILVISLIALLLFGCASALLAALLLKNPTDSQCGVQTTIWCQSPEPLVKASQY